MLGHGGSRIGEYGPGNIAESWLLAYPEVLSSWALPAGRWALVVVQTLSEAGGTLILNRISV